MARIKKFEDVEAWQMARALVRNLYTTTRTGAFEEDWDLRRQLRKAGVSIMSNIAEGFERRGDAEFRHFLSIAKGSNGEVQSQLYVALDAGLIPEETFQNLYNQAKTIGKRIGGLMRYLSKEIGD